MSVAVLDQILPQLKDVCAVTQGLAQESVGQSASLTKANAAAEAFQAQAHAYRAQDRQAQAQTAHLITIQFDRVGRELAFRSESSGRSSPKSAMGGNSQACSEWGNLLI